MIDLAQKKCVACEGSVAPFSSEEAVVLLKQVKDWTLADDARSIVKRFTFKNFVDALSFVDTVGAISEAEGHHPDIELSWGKVVVRVSTHAISGLSENDFILAAKIDAIA